VFIERQWAVFTPVFDDSTPSGDQKLIQEIYPMCALPLSIK